MAKKEKKETPIEEVVGEIPPEETPEVNPWEEKYNQEHDQFLRLAAEFDNYRKRTQKEKEASYGNGKTFLLCRKPEQDVRQTRAAAAGRTQRAGII